MLKWPLGAFFMAAYGKSLVNGKLVDLVKVEYCCWDYKITPSHGRWISYGGV